MYNYACNSVDEAIRSRRSVRAFANQAVDEKTIREILETAARAPSGTTTQPWQVYVLCGRAKEQLSKKILAAYDDPAGATRHKPEYQYCPTKWTSP